MEAQKNFVKSVAVAAVLIGLISTAIFIYNGYAIMDKEPTGSMVPPGTVLNLVVCLVGTFTGLLAVKLQAAEEPVMTLGRGAVIGVATGVTLAVSMTAGSMFWEVVDPEFSKNFMEAMRRFYEAMPNMPEDALEKMVDGMEEQFTLVGRLKGLGFSALLNGLLNALTGLLGAKLFTSRPEETL